MHLVGGTSPTSEGNLLDESYKMFYSEQALLKASRDADLTGKD